MIDQLAILPWVTAVAVGGALGGLLRHGVYIAIEHRRIPALPISTLTVNLVGSLLIGFLVGLGRRELLDPFWVVLLVGGTCGAFTTFSSFVADWLRLQRQGRRGLGVVYVVLTVVAGIGLAFVGMSAADML